MNNRTQNEPGTITVAQASKLLMVTPRRLRQLAAEGHIPSATKGRYPLAGVVRGYLAFLKESVERSAENPGAGLASAKEKETRLRLRQREAQIVDAVDVERFHSFSAGLYRRELAGLGKSVTRDPILAGQIDAALSSALDRFNARFAEALPKMKRGLDPLAHGSED